MPSTRLETTGFMSPDIVSRFESTCARQLQLCQRLEDIADNLGTNIDRYQLQAVANEILQTMSQAHDFEAEILFPAMDQALCGVKPSRANSIKRSLQQLRSEHDDDMCLVGEVVETLLEFSTENSTVSPDAIGYLLRGLFVSLTRHLAYEKEVMHLLAPST